MTAALPEPAALQAMLDAATDGPWYPGCLADDSSTCNCQSILAEDGRMGAVGRVYFDGDRDHHGAHSREYPTRDEAKANLALIAIAPQLASQRIADAAEIERLRAALEQIAADAELPQQFYDRNGPTWTGKDGHEYTDTSDHLGKCNELAFAARAALNSENQK